jgi:WD40 repeat protein
VVGLALRVGTALFGVFLYGAAATAASPPRGNAGAPLIEAPGLIDAELRDSERRTRAGATLEHPAGVRCAVASPSADRFATGGADGVVRLFNGRGAATGSVDTRSGEVTAMVFSADGRALVVAGADGQILRVDVAPLRIGGVVGRVAGGVTSLALSADAALVAAAGPARSVRVFDRAKGELRFEASPGRALESLAFSPGGDSLFGAMGQPGLAVWNTGDGSERGRFLDALGTINHLAVSPDGALLWGGASDAGAARGGILAADGSRELIGFTLPGARYVSAVAWLPGGDAALADDSGLVAFFSAADGHPRGRIAAHTAPLADLSASPDGQRLLIRADGDAPRLVTLVDPRQTTLQTFARAPTRMALARDGGTLALAFHTDGVSLHDPATGQARATLALGPDALEAMALSSDGARLAVATRPGWVRIASTATGEFLPEPLGRHEAAVETLAWSADGSTVASASIDGDLRLWNVPERFTVRAIPTGNVITALDLSADGTRVVAGTWSGARRMWLRDDGSLVRDLPSTDPRERVLSVALGPDGHTLLSGGTRGLVRMRDMDSRASEAGLMGHAGSVWAVAWSRDGTRVATGGEDRAIRVWRVDPKALGHNTLEATLAGHTDTVTALAFSPDGRTLYSISDDGTLRLWRP